MLNNTLTAEIDLGYWYANLMSKKLLGNNCKQIRSKVEYNQEALMTQNTTKIEYEGIKALVGEGANQSPISLDKTEYEHYRTLAYTLIALTIKEDTLVNLVINYPLNIYNRKTKVEFSEFLKTKDFIEVKINNDIKRFRVNECVIFPQTIPVAYANKDLFTDRMVGILDIGGLTCQGCLLDNFNVISNSRFTENLGNLILFNNIRKRLNKEFCLNIQEYEIENIVKYGLRNDLLKSIQIIVEEKEKHMEDIKRHLVLNNWELSNLEIVATGGGSLTLEDQLIKTFPNLKFSNDCLWDNCIGLRKVSEMVFNE